MKNGNFVKILNITQYALARIICAEAGFPELFSNIDSTNLILFNKTKGDNL